MGLQALGSENAAWTEADNRFASSASASASRENLALITVALYINSAATDISTGEVEIKEDKDTFHQP